MEICAGSRYIDYLCAGNRRVATSMRGAVDMAVPKRKMSRSNTRSRRSQWKAELTELQSVRVQGREVRIPRKLKRAYDEGLLKVD